MKTNKGREDQEVGQKRMKKKITKQVYYEKYQ